MKRRIKKIIVAFLLILSVSGTVLAADASRMSIIKSNQKNLICIALNEKGLYSEVENFWYNLESPNTQENDVVWVDEIGGEIFQDRRNNRYFSKLSTNDFIEVGKVEIDLNEYDTIKTVVENYNLSETVENRLEELYIDNQIGNEKIDNVSVYSANALTNRAASRTYIGYKNRKYYEEIITYTKEYGEKKIYENKRDAFNDYMKKSTNEIITYSLNAILNKVTMGAWAPIDLGLSLIPKDVPSTSLVTHKANLYTEYYEKLTWIYEGSNIFMGSRVTTGSYYFEEHIKADYWTKSETILSPTRFYRTPNYDTPDVLAYENYLNGGWSEFPENVVHFNKSFALN